MKRLYIAIIFLVISISLCIFEQYTVQETYKTATRYINSAIEAVDNNDYKKAANDCKRLNDFWGEKQKYMTAMIDHGCLDDANLTIGSLEELAKNKNESLEQELINAKNHIKSIYQNQKITFGNVF